MAQEKTHGTVAKLLGSFEIKESIKLINFKLKESEYLAYKDWCERHNVTMSDDFRAYVANKINS